MSERTTLTRAGYERLVRRQEEIERELLPRARLALGEAMAEVMSDWYEGTEHNAAAEDLERLEQELNRIKTTLADAEISSGDGENGSVQVGAVVTLEDLDEGGIERYRVVGPAEVASQRNALSYQSPVGRAILGRRVGEEVQVKVPVGEVHYRIAAIEA